MDYANKLKLFVMLGWVFRGKEEKFDSRNKVCNILNKSVTDWGQE
jgi:hypothetical protein